MTPTQQQLASQLADVRANGLFADLAAAAQANSLPLSWVLAIGSRETNLRAIRGDFQKGQYHGIGILQIDIQHGIAEEASADGTWATDPQPLIDYGVKLLASNLAEVKTSLPLRDMDDQMKIASAGYNCGITRALAAAMDGDCDVRTTGHDYGSD